MKGFHLLSSSVKIHKSLGNQILLVLKTDWNCYQLLLCITVILLVNLTFSAKTFWFGFFFLEGREGVQLHIATFECVVGTEESFVTNSRSN